MSPVSAAKLSLSATDYIVEIVPGFASLDDSFNVMFVLLLSFVNLT